MRTVQNSRLLAKIEAATARRRTPEGIARNAAMLAKSEAERAASDAKYDTPEAAAARRAFYDDPMIHEMQKWGTN